MRHGRLLPPSSETGPGTPALPSPTSEFFFSQKLIAIAHYVGTGGLIEPAVLAGAFIGRAAVTVCSVILDRFACTLEDKLSSSFAMTVQTEILRVHCSLSDDEMTEPRTIQRLALLRDLGQSGLHRKAFDPLGLFGVCQTALSLVLSAAMFKSTLSARNVPLLALSLAFMALEELDRKMSYVDVVEHYDVSNDAYLRFQNLFKLGTSRLLRREVVTLGIQDHIYSCALEAKSKLQGVSTTMSPAVVQQSMPPLRWTNIILALARPISTTLFIWQAAVHNRRPCLPGANHSMQALEPLALLAEMNIADGALWDLRVRSSSLRRQLGDARAGLDKIQALYEADDRMRSKSSCRPLMGAEDNKRGLHISLKNVTLRYPSGDVPALDDVSFNIEAGELTVLVGRNGSGKSTLLSLFSKSLRATAGEMLLDNRPINAVTPQEMAEWTNVAFQSTPVLPMSIQEYVALPARGSGDVALQVQRALNATSADAVVGSLEDGLLSYPGGAAGSGNFDWVLPQLISRDLGPPILEPLSSVAHGALPSSLRDSMHSDTTTLVETDLSACADAGPNKRKTGIRYTSLPAFVDTDHEATIHFPNHAPEPCLLSGGQWQRLVLARAICASDEKRLLLLDEPGASLDPVAEAKLMDHVLSLRGKSRPNRFEPAQEAASSASAWSRQIELLASNEAGHSLERRTDSASQETVDLLQVPPSALGIDALQTVAPPSPAFADGLVFTGSNLDDQGARVPSLQPASTAAHIGLPSSTSVTDSETVPTKKLSNTQKFLRKARSFGTSPLLGSSATFGATNKANTSPSPSPSPTFGTFPNSSNTRLSPTATPVLAFPDIGSAPGSGSTSTSLSPDHSPTLASVSFALSPSQHSNATQNKRSGDLSAHLAETETSAGKRKSTFRRSTFSIFRRNDSAKSPPASDLSFSPGDGPADASRPPIIPPLPSMPSSLSWKFGSSPHKSTTSSPASVRRQETTSPVAAKRMQPPPFRRSSSAGSPTASIKRNSSWSSSMHGGIVDSPESELPPALIQNMGSLRVVETPSGRKVLTRAGRSNSDGPTRGSLPSLTFPQTATSSFSDSLRPSSTLDVALGSASQSNEALLRSRPPSPLKSSFSPAPSSARRPMTADQVLGPAPRVGMLSAVAGLFAGSSSSSSNLGSASMSRSTSATSSAAAETSEFGALFGGSSSSSKRKRGLSVGDRIFSVTKDTRKRADSSSSLQNSWIPPANPGSNLQVPTPDAATPMAHGRSRASTDPKRLSTTSSTVSSGSYFPPFPATGSFTSPPDSPEAGQAHNPRRLSFVFGSNSNSSKTTPPASRKTSFSTQQTRSRSTSIKVDIEPGETPAAFVDRLRGLVSKAGALQVLASSANSFFAEALKLHLETYNFAADPLDIAIRKFLMDSSLPTEAQQIDRVMEALARRYIDCNPGLFSERDTPYVLAFSFIMLSTDHFNPNNKSKMTRADYVRNTKINDVTNELLEYFYDQITLAPFVHVDDDPEFGLIRPEMRHASSSLFGKSTSSSATKAKLDPQAFVASGEYRNLRLDIASVIPQRSPFSYTGTTSFFNATSLHRQFALAPVLQVTGRVLSKSSASSGRGSSDLAGADLTPVPSNTTYVPVPRNQTDREGILASIKVTKIGTLNRKEDLAEGGRKSSSRKWKGWTVILTSSQLLFFKDAPTWATLLLQEVANRPEKAGDQVQIFSIQAPFKPDAVLSLAHTAAIYDSTYSKYTNVFRLVAPAGRQYLFQTTTKEELNSWLHAINYAASLKTAGIKLRPLAQKQSADGFKGLSFANSDVSISGTSSDVGESPVPSSPCSSSFHLGSSRSSRASSLDKLPPSRSSTENVRGAKTSYDSLSRAAHSSFEPENGGENDVELLMKETGTSTAPKNIRLGDAVDEVLKPLVLSRADQLRTKIAELESEIDQVKVQLRSEMRIVSNLDVLTPFRTSTRDRIVASVPPIEKRVRQVRMRLATLLCHREVLSRELLVEDREDRPVRHGSHRRRNSQRRRANSPNRTPRIFAQPWSPRRGNAAPDANDADAGPDARDSFDSAAQNFYDAHQSLTDDELDRLKTPPPMQRSQTETLWTTNTVAGRLRSGSAPSDDEFLSRPNMVGSRDASPTMPSEFTQLAEDPTTPKVSDVRKSFDDAVRQP
ncbi:hypothetical protein OIV83_003606 [Microbotryomycetes sp. JL201]|nr:hypothetical protein OIV83_003606 [Microbotryomycetes sp. JL201]